VKLVRCCPAILERKERQATQRFFRREFLQARISSGASFFKRLKSFLNRPNRELLLFGEDLVEVTVAGT
jgi:hypothetical protein